MRFDALKEKPVMSIADGTELGKVHELLLDDAYQRIAALVLGGGLFGGHKRVVPYEAVHGVGPDAIMVTNREAVVKVTDDSVFAVLPELRDLQQVVMSENGTQLGRLDDAEFEPKTGTLTQVWVVPAGAGKRQQDDTYALAREDILSINAKLAVVGQDRPEQQSGGAEKSRTAP